MAGRGSVLPSVMSHAFSRIPAPQIQRSVFDRSHGHKTTFDAGYLVPFFLDEVLPGDTINLTAQLFARLSTLLYPIMDNVFLDTFFFYVPNRILWNNWERFNGAQDDPDSSIDFEVPEIDLAGGGITALSLGDYFGLPVGPTFHVSGIDNPSALPFRAYNLIWNEWFRDQNLQDSLSVSANTDGPDALGNYVLQRRGKRHDYFTSCLPWPQKGDSVALPLGTTAPVIGEVQSMRLTDGTVEYGIGVNNGSNDMKIVALGADPNTGDAFPGTATSPAVDKYLGLLRTGDSGLEVDLSNALAATVNQLREAFAFQQILEKDARGGTRYIELLKSHFGVTVPDFRLQRPEYLGGSSQRVNVNAVAQTAPQVNESTILANLAAYSNVQSRAGFSKSFLEHGWVIGLVNLRADITYQEGLNRMWSRKTRFDFYMPALAHLGEQAVLNKEIWYNNATSNTVFGYQERWAEYRYKPSMVTGAFRSNYAGTLDPWHLALDFSATPVLNASFIQDDPPVDRILTVTTEPHVLMDSYISYKHARPMPVYSVPGLTRL